MNTKKLIFLSLTFIFFLPGCSGGNIEKAKNLTSPNPAYTYGQVYDNRGFCKDVKWSESNDTKGRTIVDYSCAMELKAETVEDILKVGNSEISFNVERHSRVFNEKIEQLNYLINTRTNANSEDNELAKFKSALANTESIKDEYFSILKEKESNDRKTLENHFRSKISLKHNVQFLINDGSIAVLAMRGFIDDEYFQFNIDDLTFAGFEIASPTSKLLELSWQNWWAKKLKSKSAYSTNTMPFRCLSGEGCTKQSKAL